MNKKYMRRKFKCEESDDWFIGSMFLSHFKVIMAKDVEVQVPCNWHPGDVGQQQIGSKGAVIVE